ARVHCGYCGTTRPCSRRSLDTRRRPADSNAASSTASPVVTSDYRPLCQSPNDYLSLVTMENSVPDSRTAYSTSLRLPIPLSRAASFRSSRVRRSRFMRSKSGSPFLRTITGSPARRRRETGRWRVMALATRVHPTKIATASRAPVIDMSSWLTPCCTTSPMTTMRISSSGVSSASHRLPVPRTISQRNQKTTVARIAMSIVPSSWHDSRVELQRHGFLALHLHRDHGRPPALHGGLEPGVEAHCQPGRTVWHLERPPDPAVVLERGYRCRVETVLVEHVEKGALHPRHHRLGQGRAVHGRHGDGEGRCDPGPGDVGVEDFQGDPPGCRHGGGGSEAEKAEEGSTDQQGDDTLGDEPEPAIRPVGPDVVVWARGEDGPVGTHGRKLPLRKGR